MRKAILFVLPLLLWSCKDQVDPAEYGGTLPIGTPVVTVDSMAYDYLHYSWAPVADAVEYGYKLEDISGAVVGGGLTKKTEAEFDELNFRSDYTFSVWAYPTVGNSADQTTSAVATLNTKTPFFALVNDAEGTYTSVILTTITWNPVLNEERTASDAEFGTFTLSAWYRADEYDLQFRVNYNDSSIQVLNGEPDEESGMLKVLAGPETIKTNQYVRKGVLIDEKKCRFDYLGRQLRLYVRSTKDASREGYDVFDWN